VRCHNIAAIVLLIIDLSNNGRNSIYTFLGISKYLGNDHRDARKVTEDQENPDQEEDKRPDGFGQTFKSGFCNGAAHKEADSQGRGNHPDDEIEDEDEPHMEGMKAHSGENRGENGCKENDRRAGFHKTSNHQEDDVDDQ
jgi:hypothetical protein